LKNKARCPRLVIAGLRGGSGKTTLSVGLIASWSKKGLEVVPYKKGPDYIDAGWLSSAAGRPCYNLDPFLIGREKVLVSFRRHYEAAQCAVIEGNRGLYDGMDEAGTYSTAELAKLLKSPVLLIIDCTKVTRTSAAMVLGIQRFDRRVDIRGVVLNRIAGARHEKVVKESIEKYCGIPVMGAIPRLRDDFFTERHMGLVPFQEHPEVERIVARAAEIAETYLDADGIRKIAEGSGNLDGERGTQGERLRKRAKWGNSVDRSSLTQRPSPAVTIGIVRDSAFQFYYPENFDALEQGGGRLLEVSALQAKELPDIDALYIGGGFPETNAIALARNTSFRKSLKRAVERGLPVYAECGGLMYLGKSLSLGGKSYEMVGIFPLTFRLESRPQAHGYTIVKVTRENPFYRKGTVLKGHEFHYSRVTEASGSPDTGTLDFSFTMQRGEGIANKKDGLCYKNVLATYTHLHAYGAPEWADGLIKRAILYKKEKSQSAVKKQDYSIT
jgi:cobyrinic acid a,c-diamide synthase